MGLNDLFSRPLSGTALKVAARAVQHPVAAAIGTRILRRDLGIDALAELIEEEEVLEPSIWPREGRAPRASEDVQAPPAAPPWVCTSEAFVRAYQGGLRPEAVVDAIFAEALRLKQEKAWLACLWTHDDVTAREAAAASGARYRAGQPLGPLDGVPVVVKEQIAVKGLPRRLGGDLPGPPSRDQDAPLVSRLRKAGAIILGQTQMTELGMSPIGINPHRPALRNPHHAERAAGGSSTGSGIATALGLCAIAVGADGGGSIRIPAAMCGVFGLKPSYGRVPRSGDAFSGSVNHVGPIAASTRDLALFLDATHGPDRDDPGSLRVPAPEQPFEQALLRGVKGFKIGVSEHELRDADPAISKACEVALRALEGEGATLVDVKVPLLPHAAAVGMLTISAEAHATLARLFAKHRERFSPDVQVLLSLTATLEAREYLQAQALRERLRRQMASAFLEIDALLLPTTQKSALKIEADDERTGRVDGAGVRAMCRYAFLANLTGLPAGTAPVGLDPDGLPIGVQIVGDAWDEATVLTCLAALERSGAARSPRSPHHIGEAVLTAGG
jgi:aspartyl-tRNA(Asn)/glutamyl-tRNA(Gln) amidotransferase subunit A